MYERFTERARQVVLLAQEEARIPPEHTVVGTLHLLAGLIREEAGLAARVLERVGVTARAVRGAMDYPKGKVPDGQHPPFTPNAKKALEYALREALRLGHNYIGTEHLLLGVAFDSEPLSSAGKLLEPYDVKVEVIHMLAGPSRDQPPPPRVAREPRPEAHARADVLKSLAVLLNTITDSIGAYTANVAVGPNDKSKTAIDALSEVREALIAPSHDWERCRHALVRDTIDPALKALRA